MAKDIPIDVFDYPKPPARKASDYLGAYKGWIYSAIKLIAQDTSTIPLSLYKYNNSGQIEEVADHDALSALRIGNEYQTEQQLRAASVSYLKLIGEFAWLITRAGRRIVGIYPLRPDWIDVKPDGQGGVAYYEYRPGGSHKSIRVETENLIMHRSFNPENAYRGYGEVQAAALDIDIDEYSDRYNRNFFFNSALPSMFISTDANVDKASKRRFVEKFQSQHGGTRNAHKVAFMDGGKLNIDKVSANMQELDFQESKERLRDKILSSFLVSKANIGLTDNVNLANAQAQERRYKQLVVKPTLVSFVGFLNEFYLPLWEDTEDFFFNFEDPVPEDQETKLELYKTASQEGWVSTNEVRQDLLGLDPVEGGDVIYKPFNLQPIATVTEGIGSFVRGLFGRKGDQEEGVIAMQAPEYKKEKFNFGAPVRPKDARREKMRKLNENIQHDIKKLIVLLMKQGKVSDGKVETAITDEYRKARWKAFVEESQLYEQSMVKIVQDLSRDQQQQVVSNLTERRGLIESEKFTRPESVMFNPRTEKDRWYLKIRPFIARLINEQGNGELRDLALKQATSLDMASDLVVDFLETLGNEFVLEIQETTRDQLIETIREGIEAAESYQEIVGRVVGVYEDLRGYRAERIARTEVLRSLNFGSWVAYKQSGVVVEKEWLATMDDRVRDAHSQADGQRVGIDESFNVGGEELMYPVDPAGSATNTIHCRCTTIPITVFQREVYDVLEKNKKNRKVKKIMKAVSEKMAERELEDNIEKAKLAKAEAEKIKKRTEQVKQSVYSEAVDQIDKSIKQRTEKKLKEQEQKFLENKSLAKYEYNSIEKEISELEEMAGSKFEELKDIRGTLDSRKRAIEDEIDTMERSKRKDAEEKVREYRKRLRDSLDELDKSFKKKKKDIERLDKDIKEKESIIKKAQKKADDIISKAKGTANKYKEGALKEFKILRDRVENVIKKNNKGD